MSEEKKTDHNMEQTEVTKTNQVVDKQGDSRIAVRKMASYGGVFVVGVLVGSLIVGLAWKQPWKQKESVSKTASGVKTVSGDYDIQDCIQLGDYDGITVSLAVTQDDVDTEIESLQEEYTTYEQQKGTVQDGDMIYANFAGYVDNKKVEDASGSDYIEIGSEDWMEGFSEAFIGAETGKKFSFDIDVPEGTFGDDSIDGKKVTFKATVKYICGEEIVPEYNDDFVQSISEYKTVEEYNAYLRSELASEYEADKAEYAWSEVTESSEVKLYPEDLLEAAKKQVLQEYYDMADLYGMSHDEIFQSFGRENEQDFVDNDLEELAQDTVKEQLVVRAIAEKEKINYTEEEYNELVEEEYTYNSEAYSSQEEYEKADREYLEETALLEAVKNWITERATFTTEE